MKWYFKAFRHYSDFKGRARRKEFWIFNLFNVIAFLIVLMLAFVLVDITGELYWETITILYLLAMIIPSIAVTVRRLHDTGKNGWMILLGLIPIIGTIWLFVLFVSDSNLEENEFGKNPKLAE